LNGFQFTVYVSRIAVHIFHNEQLGIPWSPSAIGAARVFTRRKVGNLLALTRKVPALHRSPLKRGHYEKDQTTDERRGAYQRGDHKYRLYLSYKEA
jgi:hypothetical protein